MNRVLLLVVLAGAVTVQRSAAASISTINGYYDLDSFDTPSLHISDTTAFDFTNVVLTLTGYQGLNKGVSQSVSLANIAAGSTAILIWGSIPGTNHLPGPGNLFASDYD